MKEGKFIKFVNENRFAEYLIDKNLQGDFEKMLLLGKETSQKNETRQQDAQPKQPQKIICEKCEREFGSKEQRVKHIVNCKAKPQTKPTFQKQNAAQEHKNADDTLDTFVKKLTIPQNCFLESIEAENFSRYYAISLFVRNGEGLAYLPGSSIKGFLRSALYKIAPGNFENRCDLSVADTSPIPAENRIILQTQRISIKEKESKINVYQEFVKAGTTLKTIVSIGDKFSLEQLKQAIVDLNKTYYDFYLTKFNSILKNHGIELCNKPNILRLGAFTNFAIKTTNLIEKGEKEGNKENVKQIRNIFKNSKTAPSENATFAPVCLKLTPVGDSRLRGNDGKVQSNALMENGICEFEFKEI
ncbi:hypothetical protein AGMMS49938_18500 [Fibrobacterales bacterium]|nr:hypothetical protein AGMMS49938_18500 [Fibrobacterales bacterium]